MGICALKYSEIMWNLPWLGFHFQYFTTGPLWPPLAPQDRLAANDWILSLQTHCFSFDPLTYVFLGRQARFGHQNCYCIRGLTDVVAVPVAFNVLPYFLILYIDKVRLRLESPRQVSWWLPQAWWFDSIVQDFATSAVQKLIIMMRLRKYMNHVGQPPGHRFHSTIRATKLPYRPCALRRGRSHPPLTVPLACSRSTLSEHLQGQWLLA